MWILVDMRNKIIKLNHCSLDLFPVIASFLISLSQFKKWKLNRNNKRRRDLRVNRWPSRTLAMRWGYDCWDSKIGGSAVTMVRGVLAEFKFKFWSGVLVFIFWICPWSKLGEVWYRCCGRTSYAWRDGSGVQPRKLALSRTRLEFPFSSDNITIF